MLSSSVRKYFLTSFHFRSSEGGNGLGVYKLRVAGELSTLVYKKSHQVSVGKSANFQMIKRYTLSVDLLQS